MQPNKHIPIYKNIKDDVETEFEIHNIPISLANAIRRVILSELPIVAFDDVWDDNEDYRSINIKKNTSGIHNEFLSHRLSLVPINMNNDYLKLSTKYNNEKAIREFKFNSENTPTFLIKKKNNKATRETNRFSDAVGTISITSLDLELIDEHNVFDKSIKFFYPDPYTNDYPILNILKPNILHDENGEEIEIIAKPKYGTGNINSRYCPVGTVSYSFITDESKIENVFNQKIEYKNKERLDKELPIYTLEEKDSLRKSFNLLDSQRVYHKNDNGEANKFKFVVESIGFLSSNNLIYDSLVILELKLTDILNSIKIDKLNIIFNENKLEIIESNDELLGYIIQIKNENHTIGNLLSDYFKILYCKNNRPLDCNIIVYSSYRMPHPLTQNIELKLKLNSNLDNNTNISKFYDNLYKILFNETILSEKNQKLNLKLDIVKMIFIKTINNILDDLYKIKKEIQDITKIYESSFVIKDQKEFFEYNRLKESFNLAELL